MIRGGILEGKRDLPRKRGIDSPGLSLRAKLSAYSHRELTPCWWQSRIGILVAKV